MALKLREPIVWHQVNPDMWSGHLSKDVAYDAVNIYRDYDEGIYYYTYSVFDYEIVTEYNSGFDQAKARAEELLIEFGEKIFTIDKEQ